MVSYYPWLSHKIATNGKNLNKNKSTNTIRSVAITTQVIKSQGAELSQIMYRTI